MSNEDIQDISVHINIRMLIRFVILYFVLFCFFFYLWLCLPVCHFGMLVLIPSWDINFFLYKDITTSSKKWWHSTQVSFFSTILDLCLVPACDSVLHLWQIVLLFYMCICPCLGQIFVTSSLACRYGFFTQLPGTTRWQREVVVFAGWMFLLVRRKPALTQ